MTRIRHRDEADVGMCVETLRAVYQASGYPTNWPADPARWLRPSRTLQAWVAATDDMPIAGHVILRQPPAGERSASALLEAAMRSAAANDLDLFLDVTDHLRAARALYERAGFRLASTAQADWTTPDGRPVTLHRYAWSRSLRGQRENPQT